MADTENDFDADIDTDADTDADAAGGKGSATPEQKAAIRVIGREMWRAETKSDATVEERKASWSEGRRKYMATAKRLLRALEKQGVQLTLAEGAAVGGRKKKNKAADPA